MADFLDSEADETDDEEELDAIEKKRLKRLKMSRAREEDDDDEDEDDEEEVKDLIDDNPIEEEESEGSDEEIGRKRKKNEEEEDELDDRLEDEDYDLLEENLGVKVQRKKFRRLRRLEDEESDEGSGREEAQDKEALANKLFVTGSGDEEDQASEREERGETVEAAEESEGEYSENDDFIVDSEGRPVGERRRKKKVIYNNSALQEAQDIFGVDFDYEEFEKYGEEYDEQEEEEEDEEQDYEDEDEVDGERRKRPKKVIRKKPTKKSIFEIYEPSELERGHFTDFDNEIRNTDLPERMQLRLVPVTPVPEGSDELEDEADWIYRQAFQKPSISAQEGVRDHDIRERGRRGPHMISKIKKALEFMRNQHLEVPFIAFYRKEYVQPELNINDLWKVYKFDEKWCQLKSRKMNLVRLFEQMQEYQGDQVMKDVDKPLDEGMRVLTDDDIVRLKVVQTVEELKDVYSHFLLYYSHDLPAMHEALRLKKKEELKQKKKKKKKKKPEGEEGEGGENEENGAEEEEEEEEEEGEEEAEAEENHSEEEEDVIKHAIRSDPYTICKRAGLDGLAKKFGLTPDQFGENMRDNYQRHDVDQYPMSPLEVATDYVSKKFTTPEDVLKAAKIMVAYQLSREPLVRQCVRETFYERAKLTVKPTKKGLKEIDENHSCYSLKYVKNKPVSDLANDQFLRLVVAEEDRLLVLSVGEDLDGTAATHYVDEIKQLYYRDEFSKNVQEWNELRSQCIDFAVNSILYPMLRKELRTRLYQEGKDSVLRSCRRKLYNWLKVAPFEVDFPDEDEEEWDTRKGVRVMAIGYVPDYQEAAFTCIVDRDGYCSDHLKLPNILRRKTSWREEDRLLKEADMQACRNFITSKKPHVICVTGESREALMVVADLKEIVANLVEDEQYPQISVEMCDTNLAKVYSNSARAEHDFREFPPLLRMAVSVARRIQDPLIEFSQLCTVENEILCLRYHPLQDHVDVEELLEGLYLEFINRTNEVGVDVNQCVMHPHTQNVIQFLCGLGPRKGQALLKTLKQTQQRLENRTQLVTMCHMGPKVFINCAGFIKIDTNSLGDSTEAYVEVLDGSRVHPETYEWARKMAVDALEYDDMAEDANPAGALEEILESPERLKDLDLDAFAEELERQGFGNKSITLYDIRAELNNRYKDLRTLYESPNPEEVFNMLTRETPETFYIGKLVQATVTGIAHKKPQGEQLEQENPVRNDETGLWQCPFCLKNDFPELSEVWNHFDAGSCPGQAVGIKVRLDNGISGFIPIKNLSDNRVNNPEERVQKNQTLYCRIRKIDVERFSVECTSKSSDLRDEKGDWRPSHDIYYDTDAEERDRKVEEDHRKAKQRQTYIKRVIVHPSFHNISYKEAEKLMATMDQGDVIVRPSSKGSDHLTVTWRVTEGIYQHIDVREEGKENAFSLGQSLWIGNEEFEDLDEIIARHINPMAAHIRDILGFKYHKDIEDASRDKAEEMLKEEKKKNPSKIHYFLFASKDFPGKFMLSYLPRTRPRHEFVTVTPEGFRFRQQMFDNLGALLRWFKEHFRDPIPGTPSTPRTGAMTNRTPYMGATTPSINIANMNPEAIHRVAQNLPTHMLQSLSQVASHTPHYPQTPGHYGAPGYNTYANTPYTPSGQTPFMTPYHTPHTSHTPRYGQHTPNHPAYIHPGTLTPSHRTPSHRPQPQPQPVPQTQLPQTQLPQTQLPQTQLPQTQLPQTQLPQQPRFTIQEPMDWRKAAEDWARSRQKQDSHMTPRQDGRMTPRHSQDAGRMTPRHDSGRMTPRQDYGRYTPRQEGRMTPRHTQDVGRMTPRHEGRGTPRYGGSTPRYDDARRTPRYDDSLRTARYDDASRTPRGSYVDHDRPRTHSSVKGTPRSGRDSLRSTLHTNTSPPSIVESSGWDATTLYDKN